jgi:hypothetical protein
LFFVTHSSCHFIFYPFSTKLCFFSNNLFPLQAVYLMLLHSLHLTPLTCSCLYRRCSSMSLFLSEISESHLFAFKHEIVILSELIVIHVSSFHSHSIFTRHFKHFETVNLFFHNYSYFSFLLFSQWLNSLGNIDI